MCSLVPGRDFRSSLNSGSHEILWVCLEKTVCAIPVQVMKDQY